MPRQFRYIIMEKCENLFITYVAPVLAHAIKAFYICFATCTASKIWYTIGQELIGQIYIILRL